MVFDSVSHAMKKHWTVLFLENNKAAKFNSWGRRRISSKD
jgi:hypothetical protein